MAIGIQYNSAGVINATVTPPLPLEQILPDGVAQLIVDDGISLDGMKVDITQNPPVLIPIATPSSGAGNS